MTMIQLQCDYNEGAHPLILQSMTSTNMEQTVGYGLDPHCARARVLIKEACQAPDADVHFLVGGTQTNATVIAATLRPHQGVIAAHTGHINVHETGAIERSGHKVLALPSERGLLSAAQVEATLRAHSQESEPEHEVQPGMVYISYPTELGTLYSRQELSELSRVCKAYDVPLFVDGARLGYGLMSPESEITLPELAHLADVFYIGGTKQGALFGEAVVIKKDSLKRDFRYFIKQGGGMLAKGRLLGIQFEVLFGQQDEQGTPLYFSIAKHAIDQAMRVRDALASKGYAMLIDSPTNQQFPIITRAQYEALSKDFLVSLWQTIDDEHVAIRICTSWATLPENIDKLIQQL